MIYTICLIILLSFGSASADSYLMMGNSIDRQGKDFRDKSFEDNDCISCNFKYANFTRAKILRGQCYACQFKEIQAESGEFKNWIVTKSVFTKAVLKSANLAGLRGSQAVFKEADLQSANLWGADLRGADLRGSNLQSADLRHSLTQNALLSGALFNDDTRLPFSKAEAIQRGMKWVP